MNKKPFGYITVESVLRLKLHDGNSKHTVPIHENESDKAYIPVYVDLPINVAKYIERTKDGQTI